MLRAITIILSIAIVGVALVILVVVADRVRSPSAPSRSATAVIAAWKAAGLEAESRPLAREDYGIAPLLCLDGSQRLLIASLGKDSGGRVFQCPTIEDATKLKTFYDKSGEASALFYSYTYQRDTIMVQINGSLPAEQAKRYGDVLMALP